MSIKYTTIRVVVDVRERYLVMGLLIRVYDCKYCVRV